MSTTQPPQSRVVLRRPVSVRTGTPSDEQSLLAVGAGDRAAFAALSECTAGLVRANVWRALHDPADTDLVVEAVTIAIWQQAAHFDPTRNSAVMWILDLAHRLATEHDRHDATSPAATCERSGTLPQ